MCGTKQRRRLEAFEAQVGELETADLVVDWAIDSDAHHTDAFIEEVSRSTERNTMFTEEVVSSETSIMATLLADIGSLGDAAPLFRRALEGRAAVLGPQHPATCATVHGFARLLRDQGDAQAADALLTEYDAPLEAAPA